MQKVFINYRTGDGEYAATHLHAYLAMRLGENQVFKSSESIPPGDPYIDVLVERAAGCDVMLSVIGRHWLSIQDDAGLPKIRRPDDWVRQEIVVALEHRRRIVPVVLTGARLPLADELPDELKALAGLQRRDFDHRNAAPALARLANELTELIPGLAPAQARQARGEATRVDHIEFHSYGPVGTQIGKVERLKIGSSQVAQSDLEEELQSLRQALARALARGVLDPTTHASASLELTTAMSQASSSDPERRRRFLEALQRMSELVRNVAPLVALIAVIIGRAVP